MDIRVAMLLEMDDPIAAASTLDLKRAVACAVIDQEAGVARTRWSVAYPFQDAEYRIAAEQAVAYQVTPIGTFLALQADVDAKTVDPRTGLPITSLAEAADLILFKKAIYEDALAQIRQLRLPAKAAVKTKQAESTIRAAAAVAWPTPV